MTYEQLNKANTCKYEIDKLSRAIDTINKCRGGILEIKAIGTPHDIKIPDELRDTILDMIEGHLIRERWDMSEEFDKL